MFKPIQIEFTQYSKHIQEYQKTHAKLKKLVRNDSKSMHTYSTHIQKIFKKYSTLKQYSKHILKIQKQTTKQKQKNEKDIPRSKMPLESGT